MLPKDTQIFASFHPNEETLVLSIIKQIRAAGWHNLAVTGIQLEQASVLESIQQSELVLIFLSKAFARDNRLMLEEFTYTATVLRKFFIPIWLDSFADIQQDYKNSECDQQILSSLEMLTAKNVGITAKDIVNALEQFKPGNIPYTPSTPQICEKPCEAYEGDEPYIFISYAHDDAIQVYPIIKELYESGWDLWYDEGIKITERYLPVIAHHVNKCSVFVLMLTNRCLERPFVMNFELEYARKLRIPIIPVLLEEIKTQPWTEENASQLITNAIMPDKLLECISTCDLNNQGIREAVPPTIKQNMVYDVVLPSELSGFEFAVQHGSITITKYVGSDEDVIIPSIIEAQDNDFVFHVTAIGRFAFSKCEKIKTIDIPTSVKTIGYGAFSGCKSLTYLTIPEGMESINFWTFAGCESMKNLILPASCMNLEREGEVLIWFEAIEHVPQLGIVFNANKTALLYYPAQEPSIHYDIPQGVTHIGNYAFSGCKSIKNISIPDSVRSIGYSAFSGCDSLNSITIPANLTNLDGFKDCKSFVEILTDEKNPIFTSINGVVFNKEKTHLLLYPKGKNEKTYNVPEGVTHIGERAFSKNESLTSISLPNSLTNIGKDAFKYTPMEADILKNYSYTDFTDLQEPELQNSLKEYLPQSKETPRALICCADEDVRLIKDILAELYWEGFNLYYEPEANSQTILDCQCVLAFFSKHTATCEQTMNTLKEAIKHDVSKIIQIFIDDCDWPEEIKNKMHDRQAIFKSGCSNLEFAGRIRDGLRYFGCALGHPRGFDVKNLGDSVEIKKFYPTDYLHIVVPKTFFDTQLPVTIVGERAFSDNLSKAKPFKSIILPDTLKIISAFAFQWATGLEKIIIPNGVTTIGNFAFSECLSLSSIYIPDSVTSIENNVFNNTTVGMIFAQCDSVAWEYAKERTITCYDGEVFDGVPHGKGKIIMKNGLIYDGNFSNGKCHGEGKLTLPNGSTYEGIFNENHFYEKDKMVFEPGTIYDSKKRKQVSTYATVYEGDFINDIPHGNGKRWYANRYFYEGNFRDNKPHGIGKLILPTGVVFEGEFVNGYCSKGIKKIPDGAFNELQKYYGSLYEGDILNGKFHGKGKVILKNGVIYEGDFSNDNFHGKGTLKSINGDIFEGEFVNGKFIKGKTSKDFNIAIAYYDKAIQLNPKDASAYINRGFMYAQKKNYNQAIADYSQAILLEPNNANAYLNRGIAYRNKLKLLKMYADFIKAFEIDPNIFKKQKIM